MKSKTSTKAKTKKPTKATKATKVAEAKKNTKDVSEEKVTSPESSVKVQETKAVPDAVVMDDPIIEAPDTGAESINEVSEEALTADAIGPNWVLMDSIGLIQATQIGVDSVLITNMNGGVSTVQGKLYDPEGDGIYTVG